MPQNFQFDELAIGTCYYPEHWPENMWSEDLRRMKEAGIRTVRIAEFAWSLMEPSEGTFDFDLFDRFLVLCADCDMKVIVGTPTATPPIWLTEKYPEALNCRIDGVPYRHGGRRHYNYNSPKYRELTARIVEQMAAHFGGHPQVIGWQIDNEVNCETDDFYSEADTMSFRRWAREKYGNLAALNDAWGTAVWSQTYTDWDQIFVPRLTINRGLNPHHQLDYRRFVSDSAISFCRLQSDIIRRYKKPGDFITTNGLFPMDNHRLQEECLDLYMYDSYPNFANGLDRHPKTSRDLNDRKWSRNLIDTRSVCPHFGIMEQQAGAGGWVTRMEQPNPRPGQLNLWAMQSLAHGADYISFFRWRTATIGTEIYWHGILDYDNRDNRRLAEIRQFGENLKKMPGVCGASVKTVFGLLRDYDNECDAGFDVWHERLNRQSDIEIFAASELTHTPYDVVDLRDETDPENLSAWPVLIYPHPVIMTERRAEILRTYVEQGGTLILGCRSGCKDSHGHCVMLPQPGLLAGITGTDIREFTFVSPAEEETYCLWGEERYLTPVFNDVLEAADAETNVLAVYGNSYYAGGAAVTEHPLGKGRCIHVGAAFTRELVTKLLDHIGIREPFADVAEVPETVETVMREKDGRRYLFLLNFSAEPQTCTVRGAARALLKGTEITGELVLPPFGTEVLAPEE